MKLNIALFLLSVSVSLSIAQEPKDILLESFEKCQSILNGQYEMTKVMVYMSKPDTVRRSIVDCHFKKIEDDPDFPVVFRYKEFFDDTPSGELMYTGEDYVMMGMDSTAIVMTRSRWPEEIESYSDNPEFFSPLTNKNSSPLPREDDPDYKDQIVTYVGEEMINGRACHHIYVDEFPKKEPDEMIQTLRLRKGFWINKADMIPIQYTITFDLLLGSDTLCQYERFTLTDYHLNGPVEESIFALSAIPSFYTIKDYVPYESPDPLPVDTIAPDWTLPALDDEPINLHGLKGHVVLLDFFYKSCYPCLLALPALQDLHEKYSDEGLRIIGINPFDSKEDGIAEFMNKRGVTYSIVLDGREVVTTYRVSGYPTLYLIDKSGSIVFVQEGYGKSVEKRLRKLIKKLL